MKLVLLLLILILPLMVKADWYVAAYVGTHNEDWDCPEVCFDESESDRWKPLGFFEVGYEKEIGRFIWDTRLEHVSAIDEYEEGYGGNFFKTGFKYKF